MVYFAVVVDICEVTVPLRTLERGAYLTDNFINAGGEIISSSSGLQQQKKMIPLAHSEVPHK